MSTGEPDLDSSEIADFLWDGSYEPNFEPSSPRSTTAEAEPESEIEGIAAEMHLDSIQELGTHHFHAHDVPTARGNKFLYQGGVVEP